MNDSEKKQIEKQFQVWHLEDVVGEFHSLVRYVIELEERIEKLEKRKPKTLKR